ncbi:MAG: hypothetical protein GY950_04110 [bacterium]|nr:hypothetical protein [bacterium]
MSHEAKKFLFCSVCKNYPDKIYEIQRGFSEKRWSSAHGGYIETRDVWEDEGPFCAICKSHLIDESESDSELE